MSTFFVLFFSFSSAVYIHCYVLRYVSTYTSFQFLFPLLLLLGSRAFPIVSDYYRIRIRYFDYVNDVYNSIFVHKILFLPKYTHV